MDFETIIYEKQGRKAIITFDRPQRLNAVNRLMGEELNSAALDFRDC